MKTHHLLFILIALPLFCSCRSSRSMLREIQALKSSLYYELTSPIYQEKADQTVYLDFIDYSNMDYYTSVKRKKSAYIPLLLYNYEGELFHLRLGESSLTQLYREFLTEALLTECNSSTCCHLIDNQKGKMIPDSAYRLEVKIRKNETCARTNSTSQVSLGLREKCWRLSITNSPGSFQSCHFYPPHSKGRLPA